MQNFDIILLSTIISTLFIVFIGLTIKEFIVMGNKKLELQENSPRARLTRFMGRVFDSPLEKRADLGQKIINLKSIENKIADMESDGVYFPESVKIELEKKRKEMICEYSGLPSMKAYE